MKYALTLVAILAFLFAPASFSAATESGPEYCLTKTIFGKPIPRPMCGVAVASSNYTKPGSPPSPCTVQDWAYCVNEDGDYVLP